MDSEDKEFNELNENLPDESVDTVDIESGRGVSDSDNSSQDDPSGDTLGGESVDTESDTDN